MIIKNAAKGSKHAKRFRKKSGPNRASLIRAAVLVRQNGQAATPKEITRNNSVNRNRIAFSRKWMQFPFPLL
ncbi:MAG: hypothetical protein INR73_26510 [Williamsia sp.]|nr:hypothetical protein [Williamsia sp.]